MPKRPLLVSLGWTLRDYAKRVWDNSGEDNVLFLAGGIAFNILLAAVPFILLLVAGSTYVLPRVTTTTIDSAEAVVAFVDRLLPAEVQGSQTAVHRLLGEVIRTRASVTLYSAIGFIWFSTRLFGSLRAVLANVFDIETDRGIIEGKIFDMKITVMATLLFIASTTITTYIAVATTRGVQVLVSLGLRNDVMGRVEYWFGRGIAFAILSLMFFALYKFLPVRRIRARTAWVAALFAVTMFELARFAFAGFVRHFNPGSFYTGTITALIIVVVWCYYAAVIFILGGEVGQVYELRRVRRLQREVLTD